MRSRGWVAVVALTLGAGPLAAGGPGATAVQIGLVPTTEAAPTAALAPVQYALPCTDNQLIKSIGATEYGCALHLLLGMEDGFRFQYALCRTERAAWLAEGFVGAGGAAGIGGFAVSAGARYQFAPAEGPRNALLIAPGVRAMYVTDAGSDRNFSLATDVTFSWLYKCSPDFAWETGFNLGVTVGLAGDNAGNVGPLFGLFTGFRH